MVSSRLRIGILFNFSAQWMGGVIYVLNIINTLDFLDDKEKPDIIVFYNPELKKFLGEINYPYLQLVEWRYPSILKGNIISVIKQRNIFIDDLIKRYDLHSLFPMHDFPVRTKTNVKLIAWWADLQEKYYPEFFTPLQRFSRALRAKLILKNCGNLVLSSNAVLDDFRKFYRMQDKMSVSIFHFVSVVGSGTNQPIGELKEKYCLPDDYFLVSNQFHRHKNHKVLLLALSKLKAAGIRKHVAFTGKLPAAKNGSYLSELHTIMNDNDLHNQVTMLGLIPRTDQLTLMRHCQAVIQPSLFEGWSTVIEDAKSLQVPVVASNLQVNIEQLGERGLYFDPHDPDELANIIKDYPQRNLNDSLYESYELRIKSAAKQLLEILS